MTKEHQVEVMASSFWRNAYDELHKATEKMNNNTQQKDRVGVWCKCGKIILTSDPAHGNIWEHYWDMGYRIGLVSADEANENFGCKCEAHKP